MIAPSTDRPPIEKALAELARGVPHYYIKSSSIVETIEHNGRIFYSKYRRINQPPNTIVLQQHLRRELTVALPLLRNDRCDHLIIEYFGNEPKRFLQTLIRLFGHLGFETYRLFRGRGENRITVVLPYPDSHLETIYTLAMDISEKLQTRLQKSWRILPERGLPDSYNIYTLPDGYIN